MLHLLLLEVSTTSSLRSRHLLPTSVPSLFRGELQSYTVLPLHHPTVSHHISLKPVLFTFTPASCHPTDISLSKQAKLLASSDCLLIDLRLAILRVAWPSKWGEDEKSITRFCAFEPRKLGPDPSMYCKGNTFRYSLPLKARKYPGPRYSSRLRQENYFCILCHHQPRAVYNFNV